MNERTNSPPDYGGHWRAWKLYPSRATGFTTRANKKVRFDNRVDRFFLAISIRWGIQSSKYCHFELPSACSKRFVPQEVHGCSSVSDSHFQDFSPVFDASSRTGQYSFRAVERSILDLAPSVILVCQCSIDPRAGTLIPHLTRPMQEAGLVRVFKINGQECSVINAFHPSVFAKGVDSGSLACREAVMKAALLEFCFLQAVNLATGTEVVGSGSSTVTVQRVISREGPRYLLCSMIHDTSKSNPIEQAYRGARRAKRP
ncbi:hypothetical protein KC318_g72 [Hortaea werneckii]|nr:hypothetical protein KC318_g72 [Hortaea werneckii]